MEYIVAAVGSWNKEIFEDRKNKLDGNWYYCSSPQELSFLLKNHHPKYIFFLHWRWLVLKEILEKNECICFHMTDLPYGRGGSPLQNLIMRGHQKTMLSAIRMEEGLDTGPIYFKQEVALSGSANEIYKRVSIVSWEMITKFMIGSPKAYPQEGNVTVFKRRKPEESRLTTSNSIEGYYDFIRMLDAPGYPKAFIKYENLQIEFENAFLDKNELSAQVRIRLDEE